ncbi:MAG: hypothetical protein L3J06_01385 [Cyclobacteriaceae bacterium]|nr:hypothetical protein [Cyclobacteriaceae bacterium]
MNISNESKFHLNEMRKWTFFLSILGFVLLGIMMIGAFSAGAIINQISGEYFPVSSVAMGIPFLFIGGIYFFPIYYLFKFSTKMKEAVLEENELSATEAFKNLKSHYKFMSILMIVMLVIYLITGVGLLMARSAIF